MYLHLANPILIEEEWRYNWFDLAHQHSLLLNDAYFYLLAYGETNPTPKLFYHLDDLPSTILNGKVSLNLKIIALQLNPTSILVVDIASKRKWTLKIKNSKENLILPNGIIWSDHGGNSEDLIIITTRGLELYKISPSRNQCKLSRFIPQTASGFWYDPGHRLVLICSSLKLPNFNGQIGLFSKEILQMDGYFLKAEKANIPVLELPPPDKAPRFELGPGVDPEDISLVALYGKTFCLVRYTADEQDFITLYHLTKVSVNRVHVLSLNCLAGELKISVWDNLLICHSLTLQSSYVFDIMTTLRKKVESSALVEIIRPICHSTTLLFTHEIAPHLQRDSNGLPVGDRYTNGHLTESDQSVDHTMERESMVSAASSKTHLDLKRSEIDIYDIASLPFKGELSKVHNSANSRYKSEEYSVDRKLRFVILDQPTVAATAYSVPDLFTFAWPNWLFEARDQLLGRQTVVWQLTVDLEEISKAIDDVREELSFLARRGQVFQYHRQQGKGELDFHNINWTARIAKQRILCRITTALNQRLSISWMEEVYFTSLTPYANEYRLWCKTQQEAEEEEVRTVSSVGGGQESGKVGNGSEKVGITIKKSSSIQRRMTVDGSMDSHFRARFSRAAVLQSFGSSFGLSFNNSYSSSTDVESLNPVVLEMEPLEPHFALNVKWSSVVNIGENISQIRADSYGLSYEKQTVMSTPRHSEVNIESFADILAIDASAHSQRPSLLGGKDINSHLKKPKKAETKRSISLTTRRDPGGSIILTQTELLQFIFIPWLLAMECLADFEFATWTITSFITILHEMEIPVIPSVSYLLINMLFHQRNYVEFSRLLERKFFPDWSDFASEVLNLCEEIELEIDTDPSLVEKETPGSLIKYEGEQGPNPTWVDAKEEVQALVKIAQEAALDMWWRLGQREAVVKWNLKKQKIREAISLCSKMTGQWKTGLFPGCVPGMLFFDTTVSYIEEIEKKLITMESCAVSAIDSWDDKAKENLRVNLIEELETEKVDLFYSMCLFIQEWDSNLLRPLQSAGGRSRLAQNVAFPDYLFRDASAVIEFKQMLGYRD